jgi:hypothetical protein
MDRHLAKTILGKNLEDKEEPYTRKNKKEKLNKRCMYR